jgi:hypothetical protein
MRASDGSYKLQEDAQCLFDTGQEFFWADRRSAPEKAGGEAGACSGTCIQIMLLSNGWLTQHLWKVQF